MNVTMNNIKIDDNIFQDAVQLYSKMFNLPPLASKIYAYLLFDFQKEGVPFDEFVDVFSASKSSVSTSICLLISTQLIVDVTKKDERKRYFFTNENYRKLRFEKIVKKMQDEISLMEQLKNLNNNEEDDEKTEIYKSLLNRNIITIQESLNKL